MPLSDEERELLDAANRATELLEHPAWKAFSWAVEKQIANWSAHIFLPTKTPDEAMLRNWQLGTINGLRLALNAPADTIRAAEEVRARLAQEDEEEDE